MIITVLPRLPTLLLFFSLCFFFPPLIQCKLRKISRISLPPAPAPEVEHYASDTTPVFNVLSFGAIGNGVTDDTKAFKMAWDTACQAEQSGILLVPRGYSFMIQSTIFTGPCTSGVVFQVILPLC